MSTCPILPVPGFGSQSLICSSSTSIYQYGIWTFLQYLRRKDSENIMSLRDYYIKVIHGSPENQSFFRVFIDGHDFDCSVRVVNGSTIDATMREYLKKINGDAGGTYEIRANRETNEKEVYIKSTSNNLITVQPPTSYVGLQYGSESANRTVQSPVNIVNMRAVDKACNSACCAVGAKAKVCCKAHGFSDTCDCGTEYDGLPKLIPIADASCCCGQPYPGVVDMSRYFNDSVDSDSDSSSDSSGSDYSSSDEVYAVAGESCGDLCKLGTREAYIAEKYGCGCGGSKKRRDGDNLRPLGTRAEKLACVGADLPDLIPIDTMAKKGTVPSLIPIPSEFSDTKKEFDGMESISHLLLRNNGSQVTLENIVKRPETVPLETYKHDMFRNLLVDLPDEEKAKPAIFFAMSDVAANKKQAPVNMSVIDAIRSLDKNGKAEYLKLFISRDRLSKADIIEGVAKERGINIRVGRPRYISGSGDITLNLKLQPNKEDIVISGEANSRTKMSLIKKAATPDKWIFITLTDPFRF